VYDTVHHALLSCLLWFSGGVSGAIRYEFYPPPPTQRDGGEDEQQQQPEAKDAKVSRKRKKSKTKKVESAVDISLISTTASAIFPLLQLQDPATVGLAHLGDNNDVMALHHLPTEPTHAQMLAFGERLRELRYNSCMLIIGSLMPKKHNHRTDPRTGHHHQSPPPEWWRPAPLLSGLFCCMPICLFPVTGPRTPSRWELSSTDGYPVSVAVA
jgi:hypothetical protein